MKTEAVSTLLNNKKILRELVFENGNILNRSSLITVLEYLKQELGILTNFSLTGFSDLITRRTGLFEPVSILHKDRLIVRYIPKFIEKKVSPYEIALSLLPKKAHLSHLSALYVNGLTNLDPRVIYINYEQTPKPVNKKNSILTQSKIDNAFMKPIRKTNNLASFQYNSQSYNVVMLNGKNTQYTGVVSILPLGFSKPVRVSNIERSLIEAMIRPSYSGGLEEVLTAFYNAHENDVSINKLLAYIRKMNYIYPYIQPLYFFTHHASYDNFQLSRIKEEFKEKSTGIIMPLDHQIIDPVIDSKAKVYYPRSLLV